MKDAYSQPRVSREGCQHFQGKCRCDTPYHLRPSTPAELAREALVTNALIAYNRLLLRKVEELEAKLKLVSSDASQD